MTAFAVCRDLILPSTVKLRSVMGLCQISWSPFPERTHQHPCSSSRAFVCRHPLLKARIGNQRKLLGHEVDWDVWQV
jgi:hypothetical protein